MELYRKVYIKSEEDLPKEKGFYFVHYKHFDERMHTQMSVVYYDETIKGLWFGKDWYDWYLQPIDITDADIEAWAETMYTKTFGAKYIQLLTKGAKAMRDGEIKHIDK